MPASLWWDLDTCNVDSDQYRNVLSRIKEALSNIGVNEEIEFRAYYTETTLSRPEIDSLNQIDNLKLTPVTSDEEDALYMFMIVDMGMWAVENDQPSPYFVISGNSDFGIGLRRPLDLGYPIFIAHPNPPVDGFVEVATRRWSWPDLSPS